MSVTTNSYEFKDKPTDYRRLAQQLEALLAGETDLIANAANTAALLFDALPAINWAGFYFLRSGELIVGPFQGKPACVRIPLGRGVCGSAAAERRTLVVPDVQAFAGHIALRCRLALRDRGATARWGHAPRRARYRQPAASTLRCGRCRRT